MARLVLTAWPVGSGLHRAFGASLAGAVTVSSADRPKSRRRNGSGFADVYLHGPCAGR
jgi:hypothetical protein